MQPGHKIPPLARVPPRFNDMDAWMTSELNVALIRKLEHSWMNSQLSIALIRKLLESLMYLA